MTFQKAGVSFLCAAKAQRGSEMPSDRKIKVELSGSVILLITLIVINLALIHIQLVNINTTLKQQRPVPEQETKK